MDAVNRNIHLLLNSIQKSDVYRTYKKQEAILEKIRNWSRECSISGQITSGFRMKKEEFASGCGTAGTRISRTSKKSGGKCLS